MSRTFITRAVAVLAVGVLASSLVSCGADAAGPSADDPLADVEASSLAPDTIMSVGPNGEASASVEESELTAEEEAKIADAEITVGIIMQTMDIEWSTEQVRGITDRVTELGGTVLNVCDGAWSVETQTACIDNMITQQPDAIISIPVDDVGMAPAYAKISEAGIKLIFIDNVARGLTFPDQYQGLVTSDNQGNGAFAAAALAEYIPEDGVVGVLDYGVDFFVTKERMRGFVAWMEENRADITVKITEFQDAAAAGDDAANFLTANPDVQACSPSGRFRRSESSRLSAGKARQCRSLWSTWPPTSRLISRVAGW